MVITNANAHCEWQAPQMLIAKYPAKSQTQSQTPTGNRPLGRQIGKLEFMASFDNKKLPF